MSINDADYIASHFLRQIQAERQKREEVVEVERANFAEVLEQLREMVDGTDRMLVEYIDDTITGLFLTQTSNPK